MPEEREYQREDYKVDHDLLKFYDSILEARVRTAKALHQYRAVRDGAPSMDIEQEVQQTDDAEMNFLHVLDLYFDLVMFKFDKSKNVELPDFVDKDELGPGFSVPDLSIEEGVKLYYRCNELLEDLDITSLEDLDRGRRVV